MAKSLENPKVSVIIPTYNRADLLPRAINSVLNQTFKDFELIVVDDGSTDNTKELISDFQKKDNRIQYIWQENSGAPAKPKNTGIKNSKGEFLAFLDSDDEWLPEKLEKQLKLFEKDKDLGIVGCNCWNIYVGEKYRKTKYRIKNNTKDNPIRILEDCFIFSSSSVVIPRFVFNDVSLYDESFKVSDDWDLYIRILKKYRFNFVDDFLLNYYVHYNNISKEGSIKQAEDYINLIKKHEKDYNSNLLAKSIILRYVGSYYMINNQKTIARKYFKASIRCAPYHFRNYINFITSLFGVSFYKKIRNLKQNMI